MEILCRLVGKDGNHHERAIHNSVFRLEK
jgi:hypothetical protein